jgi:hypothetical protein
MRTALTILATVLVLMAQVLPVQAVVSIDGRRVTVIPGPLGITAPQALEGEETRERPITRPRSVVRAEPMLTEGSRSPSAASPPPRPPAYHPRRFQRPPLTAGPDSAH